MKIKKPFPYFGNKGIYYKEIKAIFEENYRKNFIDIFAGGLEVPLNLKNEFKDINVLANVKDELVEAFLEISNKNEYYKKMLEYIFEGESREDVRKMYDNDREKFNRLNQRFKSLFFEFCPCCGKKQKEKKTVLFTAEELKGAIILFGFGGASKSLANSFYSKNKEKIFERYIEALDTIKITNDYFDEKAEFGDSFIFLDPPYIRKTVKSEEKFVGYNYATNKGFDWGTKDDSRLIEFVKNNMGKNNVFLIFGSIGNNLSNLLKDNFKCEFTFKEAKRVTFGKVTDRAEWFCLVRDLKE